MAEEKDESGEAAAPAQIRLGVTLSDFKAAVDAIKEVASQGAAQLFLSRPYRLRLVGDPNAWRDALAKRIGPERLMAVMYEAQTEMLRCLEFCLMWGGFKEDVGMLERHFTFGKYFLALAEQDKDAARDIVREKLHYACGELFTPSLKARMDRLASSSDPCIEDVDVEVVSGRWDLLDRSVTTQPFVRVQLRYTQSEGQDAPVLKAWGDRAWDVSLPPLRNFRLELDEVDIDLLIDRLRLAKYLLSEAVGKAIDSGPKGSR